jgi:hypothetical protein
MKKNRGFKNKIEEVGSYAMVSYYKAWLKFWNNKI